MRTAGKMIVAAILAVLALTAAVFAVVFFKSIFEVNVVKTGFNRFTMYLLFHVFLMLASAALSVTSMLFVLKEKSGKLVKAVYALTVVFAIPVAFFAGIWLLQFVGFKLVPPPQS